MRLFKSTFRFLFLFLLLIPYSAAAEILWFPHVSCVGDWKTEIAILNPDASQELNGVLKSFRNDGTETSEQKIISLAPHARQQIIVANEMADAANIGYMALEISSGTAIGYTKFYKDGIYRVAVPAVTRINVDTILIPHIASNAQWWTGISLVNTTSEVKNLTFEFNNGIIRTETLAANEHKEFTIKDLFGGTTPEGVASAVIKNAGGVIGMELFGSNPATGKNLLSGILLKDQVALRLYYPHIASNNNWWTGIVAYNPFADASVLTITPYTMNGTALVPQTVGPRTITLPGREKYIGTAAELSFPEGTEWFEISASRPVSGFELVGSTNGRQLAGYSGVNINGKSGVFAKREMPSNGWTGIAFVNAENSVATVTLTAYGNDGGPVTSETITLNPHQKIVVSAETLFATDIGAATCISYSSDREIVGFQLNGSNGGMLLDGLPAMTSVKNGADTIWYKDIDGDGYSDGTKQISESRTPGFYLVTELLATSGDANDDDPAVNPGSGGDVISFPDLNLEAAIKRTIGKPTGDILSSDLHFLSSLDLGGNNIQNLTGLEYCKNLTSFVLMMNQVSDITPLAELTQLTELFLDFNQISDITPLAELTQLTKLSLNENQISDITPLTGLTQLKTLSLSGNQIGDTSTLAELTQLTRLELGDNQISNISALAELTQLTRLSLGKNQISDISILAGLTQLTRLELGNNQISDISILAGLTQLGLGGNQLSDISTLAGLTQLIRLELSNNSQLSDISTLAGLKQLAVLGLGDNQISNISTLAGLTQLTWLYLGGNQISDISTLAGLTQLTQLYLGGNQISDITPLTELTQLTSLLLGDNQINDISTLAELTQLTMLGLDNNQINDISPLTGLTQLTWLYLGNNQINDINTLTGLTQLTRLDLSDNQINDISTLTGLIQLTWLKLLNNPLSDTSCNVYVPQLVSQGVQVKHNCQ